MSRSIEEISYIINEVLPLIDTAKPRNRLVKTTWKSGRCCYSNTAGQCKSAALPFSVFCKKHTPARIKKELPETAKTPSKGVFDETDQNSLEALLAKTLGFDRVPGVCVYNPSRLQNIFVEKMLAENNALEEKRVTAFFEKLFENRVDFVKNMFRIKLRKYQMGFFDAIVGLPFQKKADSISGLFTRQTGKNETIGCAIATLLLLFDGIQIGIFAPTEKQAKSIGLERVRMRLTSNPVISKLIERDKDDFIMLWNGSSVRAFTANKTSQIEGFTLNIAFLDESQDISNHIVAHDIMPMLAGVNGSSVKIGTTGKKGHFFKTCRRNANRKNKHFEFDWRAVAKEVPSYREFVDAMLEELGGEESDDFQSQFCNQWLLDGTAFTTEARLHALRDSSYIPETAPLPGATYVAGLDLAKDGDRTVLTVMRLTCIDRMNFWYVVQWYDWFGDNYVLQLKEVLEHCRYWGISIIGVDATKEDTFAEFLAEGGLNVEPYKLAVGRKSDIYKSFKYMILGARIVIPMIGIENAKHRKRFEHETEDLEVEWMPGSVMKVHHPDGEGYHDDYPDSMAMGIFASRDIVAGEVIELLKTKQSMRREIPTKLKREFVALFEDDRTGKIEFRREDWNALWQ